MNSNQEIISDLMLAGMNWWDRLETQMKSLGWSKAELSRRSGIPYDSVNKYLRGNVEQPRGEIMQTLADTVGMTLLELRDGISPESDLVPSSAATGPVVVAGKVAAGTFREVDEFDQSEPVKVWEPVDERFPRARRMAFDVEGDSVNDLKPRPILNGDRVICVSWEDVGDQVKVRDGLVVVVERTRDGGHTREWSVKQVELYEDRIEFHPRSTNPKHKPIIVSRNAAADDGTVVEIIGLVRAVRNEVPL